MECKIARCPSTPDKEPDIRDRFTPEGVYLNTATYGLPPREAVAAMEAAAEEWRHGRTGFEGWDGSVGEARRSFARIAGVGEDAVAIGPQVSVFVAMVAASLPARARVLCARGDFTSAVFPFLARGHDVRFAPLERLADAVDARTDMVAVSAVQSADGRVADLEAIAAAAAAAGAWTMVDATQACGWLPLDAGRFDVLVCGGYKWLLNPRGTAYMAVRPERLERMVPIAAGWYAGEVPMETLYVDSLRLASSARRLDVSPAWMSWIGAAPALRLIDETGVEAIHAHDLALANRFRAGMGLPPGNSAIVALESDPGAERRLRAAGVMASARGGRLRLSFHLYNTEADVDAAIGCARPPA